MMRNFVGVRVNEQQRERLEKLAKEAGLTISQLFRVLVDNAESVSKPTVIYKGIEYPTGNGKH